MRYLIIVSFLCLACGPSAAPPATTDTEPQPTATTATATTATTGTIVEASDTAPPVTTSAQPLDREIYIDSVDASANPIVVTGRARTFENNVALRLRDARGAQMLETFTTSTGEIGHHNPYRATMWVTRDPGGRVTVEALEYSAKDGSERSLTSATKTFNVATIDAQLYFPDENCTGVKAYRRAIPKSVSHARLLVEALVAGPLPSERGATSPFPQGSRVESVILRGDTITVDFNERLRNVGGACRAQMIRESVTRTLRALPSVGKVVITAAGSESLALQP